MNKTFVQEPFKAQNGYNGFPQDHIVNFTSVVGYLLPIYKDILEPGDKIKIRNYLKTNTLVLDRPANVTIRERIEWFAVPVDQLYKPFSAKYFGIDDVNSDMLSQTYPDDNLPMVKLNDLQNWISGLSASPIYQDTSAISVPPTMSEALRLCSCLGYPVANGLGSSNFDPQVNSWQQSVLALFPAAYQKIYSDHYRLTDREPNDPASYNLDSYGQNNSSLFIDNSNGRLNKLYRLQKRPYNLDYFMSAQVSPLIGTSSINSSGVDITKINQWLTGLSSSLTSAPSASANYPSGGNVGLNNSHPTTTNINNAFSSGSANQGQLNQLQSTFNPDNMRSLFAIEKLLQVTRRAKKHYDKQVLAHFGVDVPTGMDGESIKIGTHEQYINVGEVVGTSELNQGNLMGKGLSETKESKVFEFEAKCHCILMAIYSAEPLMNYPDTGLDRLNTMVRTSDWYKSEFDNLGQQPIFLYELFDMPHDNQIPYDSNIVMGWQDRYAQLKAKYNRSFCGMSSIAFTGWVPNRYLTQFNSASANFFKVWPTDLNDIVMVNYVGDVPNTVSPQTAFECDYLVNMAYLDVTKVSKKSIHGTPNY